MNRIRALTPRIKNFLIEFSKILCLIIVVFSFGYFISVNLFISLFPNSKNNELILSSISDTDLNLILLGNLLLIIIVMYVSVYQERFKFVSLSSLSKSEIFVYVLSSYFFSNFISHNLLRTLQINQQLQIVILVIVMVLLFILLPQITAFFSTLDFSYFKNIFSEHERKINFHFPTGWIKFQSITPFITIIFTALLITVVIAGVAFVLDKYLLQQKKIREQFVITSVSPKTTTIGEQVTLNGYNFGWKADINDKLMSNYGQIPEINYWNDDKIIFTTPLNWKEGTTYVWIERKKNDQFGRSNNIALKIDSRWYFYPTEEEFSSNQLDSIWIKFIKKIRRIYFLNGYL